MPRSAYSYTNTHPLLTTRATGTVVPVPVPVTGIVSDTSFLQLSDALAAKRGLSELPREAAHVV